MRRVWVSLGCPAPFPYALFELRKVGRAQLDSETTFGSGYRVGRVPEALGCRASGSVCTYKDLQHLCLLLL